MNGKDDGTRWRVRKHKWRFTDEVLWFAEAPRVDTRLEHRYLGGAHFDSHADAIAYADRQARKCKARDDGDAWGSPCLLPDTPAAHAAGCHQTYPNKREPAWAVSAEEWTRWECLDGSWITHEFARATARVAKLPPWARPVVVRS